MPNTMTHIEALSKAALDLQERMRASGLYAHDGKPGKKRSFAVIVDEETGEETVVPLHKKTGGETEIYYNPCPDPKTEETGRAVVKKTMEPYEHMGEANFAEAAKKSREHSERQGDIPTYNKQGPTSRNPVADAALRMRQEQSRMMTDARRQMLSDQAKAFRREGIERTQRIAEQIRVATERQCGKR